MLAESAATPSQDRSEKLDTFDFEWSKTAWSDTMSDTEHASMSFADHCGSVKSTPLNRPRRTHRDQKPSAKSIRRTSEIHADSSGAEREPNVYRWLMGSSSPSTTQSLYLHAPTSHTSTMPRSKDTLSLEGKRYPCPLSQLIDCKSTFSTSGHATRHMKTHRGSKEAECPTCGRLFSRSDNMRQHHAIHRKSF